jgi:hypothetical protein
VLSDLELTPNQVWGLTKTDQEWSTELEAALRQLAAMTSSTARTRRMWRAVSAASAASISGSGWRGIVLRAAGPLAPHRITLVPPLMAPLSEHDYMFCGLSVWVSPIRTGPIYLGGAMKGIRRIAVATVAAAGLVFSLSGPAAADVIVAQHKHCLLTPNGWVLIAEGVSEEAYLQEAPALDKFHADVHRGKPTGTGGLTIERVDADEDCSALPMASAE